MIFFWLNKIKYFFSLKENWKIPDIFNEYIFNKDYSFYNNYLDKIKKDKYTSAFDIDFIITLEKIIDLFKVKNILQVFENQNKYQKYILSTNKNINFFSSKREDKIKNYSNFDLVIFNIDSNLDLIKNFDFSKKTIIIIHDISKSRRMQELWKLLSKKLDNCMKVKFEKYGIIFSAYDFPTGEFIVEYTNTLFEQ